jgi:hypothetical protein
MYVDKFPGSLWSFQCLYVCGYVFRLPLESPVLVMGDASSSMSVAVKTSTIIAGILTAITNAKLSFFNGEYREPEKVPTNVEEVSC